MSEEEHKPHFPLKGTAPFLKRNRQEGRVHILFIMGRAEGAFWGGLRCNMFYFGFSWLVATRYTHPYKEFVL